MDSWDRDVDNSFDSFFDLNKDGVLDPIEQGFELDFLERQIKEGDLSDEIEDDLEFNDLDLDDLEFMDEDERREALEEAGYDPDDFEDDF